MTEQDVLMETGPDAKDLVAILREAGIKGIDSSLFRRELFSQDICTSGETCLCIVSPTSIDELAHTVAVCAREGAAVLPRGAGLSYSEGYVPHRRRSVIVDLSGMDRILELNTHDMYVTVEAGARWSDLNETLRAHGLRTPYWGPLSGAQSTVGGAMSQNSVWWGSGLYGTATESALSFSVVLADGSVLSTGSAGGIGGTPFLRTYGPDLTGLFGHDAGALGIKAHITLRLIPRPTVNRFVSHSFATAQAAFESMSRIAREQLASENFGFDPRLNEINMVDAPVELGRDLGRLMAVARTSGLRAAARVAFAGRRFARSIVFGHHAIVEDYTAAGADWRARRIREICSELGGREVEPSIPRVALADPFPPVAPAVLRAGGERWLPRQAIVPHSRATALLERFEEILAEHAPQVELHGIRVGYLCCTIATNGFLIEPQCIWPDSHDALHREIVGPAVADRLPRLPANPEARGVVDAILEAFVEAAVQLGAGHLQIGKVYPYRRTRNGPAGTAIDAIKRALDPDAILNPGALGLDD